MENVKAALVDDYGTVALGCSEGSGAHKYGITNKLKFSQTFQAIDQGGGRSDLIGKVRHYWIP